MLDNIYYKAILETVADGILIINKTGIVELFNPAAEKMFGYEQSEVLGQNVKMLMPEAEKQNHDAYLANYVNTRVGKIIGKTVEVTGRRSDGSYFPIDLSLSVLEIENDIKIIGIIRDVTQRKNSEAELLQAKQEAEKNNRATTEFISSISHELRTPLNAILGFANLMEFDSTLSSNSKNNAQKIYQAGEHLLSLVNNVMDLARIEAGQLILTLGPVSVTRSLQQAISQLKDEARKKEIKIFLDVRNCQNCYVNADEYRLEQVLINLLSNAVKFNKYQGKIIINCQANKDNFRIVIADTGAGISEKKLQDLFRPFNRLGAEKGAVEGTGIGLVITERLVKLMGGAVSVESTLGQGSRFCLDLQPAILQQRSDSLNADHFNSDSKATILVVEDNATNRELFKQQLGYLGYAVDVVEDGEQALIALEQKHYDLVLTDINMPNIDGYELTTIIRDGYGSIDKNLVIIAVTANTNQEEVEKCRTVGINDYLPKPVNINVLEIKLSEWIKHQKASLSTTSSKSSPMLLEYSEHFHPAILHSTVGPDLEKHIIVLESFRVTSKQILHDIYNAYNLQNLKDLVSQCHKLKSSSKAVGAVELGHICQILESSGKELDWVKINRHIKQLKNEYQEVEKCIAKYLARYSDIDESLDELCILIIDDDLFSIELIRNLLQQRGIARISSATSGEDAIGLLQSSPEKIDILFCDLNMPTMDGIEILRYLSSQDYKGGIALISGENERVLRSAENLAKARNLNLLGAIEKPLTSLSLDRIITSYQRVAAQDNLISQASVVTPALLKKAISLRKIETYFQPKVNMQTRQLVGVEALARWKQSENKLTSPEVFIPLAEENRLIDDITELVFLNAFQQMAQWRSRNENFSISLNISVDTLVNLDLPEIIVDYANQYHVPVENIILEITETRLMQDISSALDILTRMSLKGIKLSIDDFGTGYSSMEQLQRAPFTELKLDRAFVTNADRDKASMAILESSINLAKRLDMTIVAEGVETQQDWDLLASLGTDYAQGFFIARPMPAEEFELWLQNWRTKWGN